MTTYRTGTDGGFPLPVIVREHPAEAVAVVVNGDQALAERICELLNADTSYRALVEEARPTHRCARCGSPRERGAEEQPCRWCRSADAPVPCADAPPSPLSVPVTAQEPPAVGQDRPGTHSGSEGRTEIVHLVREGSASTRCCYRVPFELPPTDRLTADPDAVTCGIVAREPERTADCSLHTGWADKDGGWIDCSPSCAGNQRKADQA